MNELGPIIAATLPHVIRYKCACGDGIDMPKDYDLKGGRIMIDNSGQMTHFASDGRKYVHSLPTTKKVLSHLAFTPHGEKLVKATTKHLGAGFFSSMKEKLKNAATNIIKEHGKDILKTGLSSIVGGGVSDLLGGSINTVSNEPSYKDQYSQRGMYSGPHWQNREEQDYTHRSISKGDGYFSQENEGRSSKSGNIEYYTPQGLQMFRTNEMARDQIVPVKPLSKKELLSSYDIFRARNLNKFLANAYNEILSIGEQPTDNLIKLIAEDNLKRAYSKFGLSDDTYDYLRGKIKTSPPRVVVKKGKSTKRGSTRKHKEDDMDELVGMEFDLSKTNEVEPVNELLGIIREREQQPKPIQDIMLAGPAVPGQAVRLTTPTKRVSTKKSKGDGASKLLGMGRRPRKTDGVESVSELLGMGLYPRKTKGMGKVLNMLSMSSRRRKTKDMEDMKGDGVYYPGTFGRGDGVYYPGTFGRGDGVYYPGTFGRGPEEMMKKKGTLPPGLAAYMEKVKSGEIVRPKRGQSKRMDGPSKSMDGPSKRMGGLPPGLAAYMEKVKRGEIVRPKRGPSKKKIIEDM